MSNSKSNSRSSRSTSSARKNSSARKGTRSKASRSNSKSSKSSSNESESAQMRYELANEFGVHLGSRSHTSINGEITKKLMQMGESGREK